MPEATLRLWEMDHLVQLKSPDGTPQFATIFDKAPKPSKPNWKKMVSGTQQTSPKFRKEKSWLCLPPASRRKSPKEKSRPPGEPVLAGLLSLVRPPHPILYGNLFASTYFLMTGFHAIHVVVGMIPVRNGAAAGEARPGRQVRTD